MKLFGNERNVFYDVAAQMSRQNARLNIGHLGEPQILIQQRMFQRFLFAFLIGFDDEFTSGVAEFHRAALAFQKMFRRDLLPVDKRNGQPVSQPRAKFLHQIQSERWTIGTIHMAAYTGLRRGEIQKLTWEDLHLDEARPYILARASTTKNKKTAVLPLVLPLVTALKEFRARQLNISGKVFRYGVPKAVTLLKDLADCGIKGVDEHGRHLDFHALRHTFATMLARAGVSPRVAMELMRHSDMRLTAKTYTDAMNLPLFGELEKLTPALPSLIASLNCEKPGLEGDISDQTDSPKKTAECVLTDDGRTVLTELVPSLENFEMAERGGFEPQITAWLFRVTECDNWRQVATFINVSNGFSYFNGLQPDDRR